MHRICPETRGEHILILHPHTYLFPSFLNTAAHQLHGELCQGALTGRVIDCFGVTLEAGAFLSETGAPFSYASGSPGNHPEVMFKREVVSASPSLLMLSSQSLQKLLNKFPAYLTHTYFIAELSSRIRKSNSNIIYHPHLLAQSDHYQESTQHRCTDNVLFVGGNEGEQQELTALNDNPIFLRDCATPPARVLFLCDTFTSSQNENVSLAPTTVLNSLLALNCFVTLGIFTTSNGAHSSERPPLVVEEFIFTNAEELGGLLLKRRGYYSVIFVYGQLTLERFSQVYEAPDALTKVVYIDQQRSIADATKPLKSNLSLDPAQSIPSFEEKEKTYIDGIDCVITQNEQASSRFSDNFGASSVVISQDSSPTDLQRALAEICCHSTP